MRVDLLGPLVLDLGAGPTPVGGPRLRALLARLALDAGRGVRPESLVESLWAGEPPADRANALQSLVSRLRRVLGDPALLTAGPAGYRLAVEPDAVVAVRVERLARSGRQSLAQDRPAEAVATLREALGLWSGPALADVREAPFGDTEAARLERVRLAATEDRIEAELALGHGPDLVAELESLTAGHPLHERLHAQLIRALAAAGRRAEALAAYQRLRDRLADTFGSDPGPRLQAAHLAVLRGEVPPQRQHPDAHRPFRRSRVHGNLDAPLTRFIGRQEDVRRVVDLLDRTRLVTLVGPGGSGKTRLAGAAGHRLTPSCGVWFVALAPVGPDGVARAALDTLRARDVDPPERPPAPDRPSGASPDTGPGSPGEILDRLAETVADDDLVLVLDNCEHVIETAAALAGSLLGRCPRLRILATSREPLRIDGETLHPVLPLDLPEPGAPAPQARACAAIRLFQDRAGAVRPGFTVDDDLPAVIEICRRLDGLPLAIELAAARLRTLPIEVVTARLDDRFRLLTGGSRTALPRHRTLRAVVAWSWDLLADDERALLERLAVVPGSFAEDAARAVFGSDLHRADDVEELLSGLADKSLLHPVWSADTGELRHRMPETVREYGLEQLAGRGETGAVRARLTGFLLDLVERAEPRLRTRDQLRLLARLSAERDNLFTAVRRTVEAGDAATAVRFGAALCWYWTMRGNPPESLDLLGQVLAMPGPADPVARALVVVTHTLGTEAVGPPHEAEAAFHRMVRAVEGIDPGVHPLLEMARSAVAAARPAPPPGPAGGPDATDAGCSSPPPAEGAGTGGDPWSRAFGLMVRGLLAMRTGDLAGATELLARARTGFEALGERWGAATTLSTLGSIRQRSGDPAGALALNEEAARYFQELDIREYSIENDVQTGLAIAQAGDVEGGRRLLEGLLDEVTRAGAAEPRAHVRLGLARLEWLAGRPGPAREHARIALAESPDGRAVPSHLTALLLAVLAQADTAEGRPEDAARRLDHPAVHLMLARDTPAAAGIVAAVAGIELGRDRPASAARLLGAAAVLRGPDDLGDAVVRGVERRAAAALGDGFAAARAAGAAMPRTEARGLASAVVAAPGARPGPTGQPGQPGQPGRPDQPV
ncbi:BTAD domain-containing putative transcriptional regulator [Kitasatospora sp. NPDC002965]|uniref:BTAD domain-containing putative transcriptional regulator n=1 Tax=Kitasatospora sp. NPDC002965 TaxID=3154775 RepID=UPI0033BC74AF